MKKTIIIAITLLCTLATYAQEESRPWLKGMNFGIGLPAEYIDLHGAGLNIHLGYDFARPLSDNFALGFYVGGAGGFIGALHPYNEYDHFYVDFKVSAGVLMEFGNLNEKPWLVGFSPCVGLGFVDMDLVLPVEFRFGRMIDNNWYIMGQFDYYFSTGDETICVEPSILFGYNFAPKTREKKK